MILNNKSIQEISSHKYGRFDCKYWNTQDCIPYSDFIPLKDLFEIVNGSVQTSNYVSNITSIPYIRIGDINYKFGISLDEAIYLDKETELPIDRVLKDNDLVLATIGATVGKIGIANKVTGGTHSNNTVVLRAKKDDTNCLFYEKLLQSDYFMKYIYGLVAQKAQPNLQPYEIENIKIPIISAKAMDKAVRRFEPIENEISTLKGKRLFVQNVINSVFQREFNFDYDTFEELRTHKNYTSRQSLFSNNPDLRFSVKYHRPAGDFVMKQLSEMTDKKIKHFLAEPIVLGASISPGDFDENGETYYVSMATIKTWAFDAENAAKVSDEYAAAKSAKTIQKGDIILARSGEGTIGKVAIITDEDIQGNFADFTMRIRLKNFNPTFAYYYFRTVYFQYLIEIYKKGLGNNTNIFPIVIQEFPIPDILLSEQQCILDEIQAEISKQDEIENQITKLRSQIDDIIMDTIRA